jgi:hypothetical protein
MIDYICFGNCVSCDFVAYKSLHPGLLFRIIPVQSKEIAVGIILYYCVHCIIVLCRALSRCILLYSYLTELVSPLHPPVPGTSLQGKKEQV